MNPEPRNNSFILLVLAIAAFVMWQNGSLEKLLLKPASPNNPVVEPDIKPTAMVYVHEKDEGTVPPAVVKGLYWVNVNKKIPATIFEDDGKNGTDGVPEQYKLALVEARKVGLPALVVEGDGKVLRVVKGPKTDAEIQAAAGP